MFRFVSVGKRMAQDRSLRRCLLLFLSVTIPCWLDILGKLFHFFFFHLSLSCLKYEDMTICFPRLVLALPLWFIVNNIEESWTAYFQKMLPGPKIKPDDQQLWFAPRRTEEKCACTRCYMQNCFFQSQTQMMKTSPIVVLIESGDLDHEG